MTKSFVLKAMRIFGLEEMLKLAESVRAQPVPLKKAAGEELIVWNDAPDKEPRTKNQKPHKDNILPFKRPEQLEDQWAPAAEAAETKPNSEETSSNFSSTEFLLWQRELSKDSGAPLVKKEAVKGYSKATEMYVVKTPLADGKEKIRFASTNGVLVNKKQA